VDSKVIPKIQFSPSDDHYIRKNYFKVMCGLINLGPLELLNSTFRAGGL
jgi:hypothetical protein